MKELWTILMLKIRDIDSVMAVIMIMVATIFTIGMGTTIIFRFFDMIVEVVSAITGAPVG